MSYPSLRMTPVLNSPWPTWCVHRGPTWSRVVLRMSNLPIFLKYMDGGFTQNAYNTNTKGLCGTVWGVRTTPTVN
jgi:hypothetical protein